MTSMTRKQQREHTRQRLLDGAMMCLVEYGYANTTTQRVQDQVGVSRGALLHHFGSKYELFVAATQHIADLRLDKIRAVTDDLGVGGTAAALRKTVLAIRKSMTGPPFQAAMELWTASRTDAELRAVLLPAERQLGHALREIFDRHSGISDDESARLAFESLLALLRGLELTRIMRSDPALDERIVQRWIEATLGIAPTAR